MRKEQESKLVNSSDCRDHRFIDDLSQCPKVDITFCNQTVTMGDGHGNALKIVYFLLRTGRVDAQQFTSNDYNKFKELYYNAQFLTADNLSTLSKLIKKLKRHPELKEGCGVRFIGDNFSDRGQNDYLSLLIYKQLTCERIPFCELLSNHTMEFLSAFMSLTKPMLRADQSNRMLD